MARSNTLVAIFGTLSLIYSNAVAAPFNETALDARTIKEMKPFISIGYAKCQTATYFGGQLVTGEREDLFVLPGNLDSIDCGAYENAPLSVGATLDDHEWFSHPVCGPNLNFAPINDGYDIWREWDQVGHCNPHSAGKKFCPSLLNLGNCEVEIKYWCGWFQAPNMPCA